MSGLGEIEGVRGLDKILHRMGPGVHSVCDVTRSRLRRDLLVETPDQWRWSSFRAYAYGESGLVRVNDWSVLKMKIRAA